MDLNAQTISKIIDNWIDEDIGRGDLTSSAITNENGNAYWIAKEEGIFCGVEILKEIFKKIDLKISSKFNISDGDKFVKDQKLLEIYGPSKSLLARERIGLNIAMHLSGISTYTKNLVNKLEDTDEIIKNKLPFDLLSIELRDGIQNLSKITGQELTEELLDNIFSKFCIGK